MTRILIQRGSAGLSSSSNQNRSSTTLPAASPSSSSASPEQQATSIPQVVPTVIGEDLVEEGQEQIVVDELSDFSGDLDCQSKGKYSEELPSGILNGDRYEGEKIVDDEKVLTDDGVGSGNLVKGFGGLTPVQEEIDQMVGSSFQVVTGSSRPPPPPAPPPKPSSLNFNSRRYASSDSNAVRTGSSRRPAGWLGVSSRSSPTGSRPSSSRSHCEGEGYNSADEQIPCFTSSYDDAERERQFEIDLRRAKGFEVRKMIEDGNCLFRAVADQVYGDSELYDLVRQMCIDYMERERDHFSQFITEGFTSYCKRKRRDKVYGNNVEIQALSEILLLLICHFEFCGSCDIEPINIFHGSYNTDTPPIRLSYHHGNHYNSLVDPRRLTIGAGLGFSSLHGTNIDKDQVKSAIKAQQDQQIDNALLAEGRFYSDLELTEKEIEHMVMEASRAEYLADGKFKQQHGFRESSTSMAEPSSSAARTSGSDAGKEGGREFGSPGPVLSDSMQIMLSMGFSYLQVMEAYGIFGDDVDSMVSYLIETSSSGRRKGKATE